MLLHLLACVSAAMLLASVDAVSAHEGDSDGVVVVHVTDRGFEPQSVEIGPGDTVVFENAGSEAHWPASDDHPMHTLYPGFDPRKPLEPGAEWSFTFDEPGKWAYHDHLNPYLRGKVIVRDELGGSDAPDGGTRAGEAKNGDFFASITAFVVNAYEATASAFAGEKEEAASSDEDRAVTKGSASSDGSSEEVLEGRYEGVKDDLLALVRDENPKVALDRLRDGTETDDAILRSCHPLVHEIGRAAYDKYDDFGEAMKYQDEICNAGYLHGVIESRLSQSTDIFADMRTMCEEYPPGRLLSGDCYHGLGHGVMFYTANDLPRSLEMCDSFESSFGRSNCIAGVFMENFNADQKLHLSAYLKESDPFYPCAEQANRHKGSCYVYAPTYYLSLNKEDYVGALEWCGGAEADFRSDCAFGVGRQTIKENLNDPKSVETTCMSGEPEQVSPCIRGMVVLYANHHGSLEPARTLCEQLGPSNRRVCYGTVERLTDLFKA